MPIPIQIIPIQSIMQDARFRANIANSGNKACASRISYKGGRRRGSSATVGALELYAQTQQPRNSDDL